MAISEARIMKRLDDILAILDGKEADTGWIGINEASRYASVSNTTLRRAIKRNDLKASTSTGKTLFKISYLEQWLQAREL